MLTHTSRRFLFCFQAIAIGETRAIKAVAMRTALLLLICAASALAVESPAIQDALLLKVRPRATAFDGAGNLYLAGTSIPADVPGVVALGPGSNEQSLFVVKIAASRSSIAYAVKIGGSGTNTLGAFTVDAAGNAYLAGSSSTADFPVTAGAFRTSAAAGSGFVVKLDAAGKLAYSTYLDQSEKTQIRALAVNASGNLYAAGSTDGLTFPTSASSYLRSVPPDIDRNANTVGFIAQLTPDGTALASSTLVGGTYDRDAITGIAFGPDGTVYVAGDVRSFDFPVTTSNICTNPCDNSFLAQFDANTSRLLYSEGLGGRSAVAIAVDGGGAVWVAQNIAGTLIAFHHRGAQKEIKPVPNLGTSTLQYASMFVMPNGHMVVAGTARTCDFFPVREAIMPCPANQSHMNPNPSGFWPSDNDKTGVVMEFDEKAALVMSTPIGGSAETVIDTAAADPKGGVFISGFAQDHTFPQGEALMGTVMGPTLFSFRIDPAGLPHGKPAPTRIVNALTFAIRPMSPGSFATLFGSGLGPAEGVSFSLTPDSRVPTEVAGVQVTVAGVPAPILYAQDRQLNIMVPQGVSGSGDVCVTRGDDRTCVFTYIQTYDMGIFRDAGGSYLAINQDGTLNTGLNPAEQGSYITVWAAGFGGYTRSFADGAVTDLPLAYLSQPVSAIFRDPRENCTGIGGTCIRYPSTLGEVPFAGAAPFAVNGLTQINIKVPTLAVAGNIQMQIHNGWGGFTIPVSVK